MIQVTVFFLGLWVLITLGCGFLGWKLPKKWDVKFQVLGAFTGFMLTMGGFIVYWAVEYHQIQSTVTKLCQSEGGVTVYVTPKEWRKLIGEDEWLKREKILLYSEVKVKNTIEFQGIKYSSLTQLSPRIVVYAKKKKRNIAPFTRETDFLYYDTITKTVLYREHTFDVESFTNSLSELKSWINNIEDCDASSLIDSERFNSVYGYANRKYQ